MQTTVRRAVLATASTCALVVGLLALKPHHGAEPIGGAPPPAGPAPSRSAPHDSSHPGGNGTYTGETVQTQYGPVQVAATVKAGRLTGVKVLRTPSANDHDRQIAADAVPRLTREALSAHSAHIDAVSGASYTSQGYIQSLQSALDKAHG
jgi:uncharacterized protein with FMN-binding domain